MAGTAEEVPSAGGAGRWSGVEPTDSPPEEGLPPPMERAVTHLLEIRFPFGRLPDPSELLRHAGSRQYTYDPHGGKALYTFSFESPEEAARGRESVLARWPYAEATVSGRADQKRS